ncbi:SpoIID/LytB domain-containing protein [Nocardioides litoris]|uniref:SpoIID/LytB domain-containing protein n=1 Tax=Nocardioides litoris TaxID=1926648 RepID=UPI0014772223|nr:SpoIID/LytB domain-containing protein [Nocardioides litoris]
MRPVRVLARSVAVLLTATGLAAVPADAVVGQARAVEVWLVGNGYGHGHGLSQWGAQRQAERGRTAGQILSFYYPGLRSGTAGGNVRVLLTADTTDDVVVRDRPGLRLTSLGSRRTVSLDRPAAAVRWRITPAGPRGSAVSWKPRGGAWRPWRTVRGLAQFSAGPSPVVLVTPSGPRAYRGALRSAAPSRTSTRRDTVNVVPLEAYVRGVVPREVYTSWRPATLRAQAVAARTYAAFERTARAGQWWHVDDTTSSQVYGGSGDEVASTDAAVAATRGRVLLHRGRPAFTQFSASNGGWAAAGSQPYLAARRDPYDDTYRGWTATVTAAAAQRAYPSIGTFRGVEVLTRDGHGQWGGRVLRVRVLGSEASPVVSGEDFRFAFGLRSEWFSLR